jgi:hypothetical protein
MEMGTEDDHMIEREIVKPRHGDFWDHVSSFINEAHDECSKLVKAGQLTEFEKTWLDSTDRFSACSWFLDARPVARKIAAESIRREVRNILDYYHWAEKLLDSAFG